MRRMVFFRSSLICRYCYFTLFLVLLLFLFYYNSKELNSTGELNNKPRLFTYSNYPDKTDEQVLLLLKKGLISTNNETLEIKPILKSSLFGEHLPHLLGFDHVNPEVYLAAPSNFFRSPPTLIIAIPTVKRDLENYFQQTVESLMNGLQDYEWFRVQFLIYIAEHPHNNEYTQNVVTWLRKTYPRAVEHGLFEVIETPSYYLPDLNQIKPTFNDSAERMTWRTKQNLDYAYMMLYTRLNHANSHLYIQLEDDLITWPGYVSHILNFVALKSNFFSCEFSQLGFIGKLFKISDLHLLTDSIFMFFKEKPVDWILSDLLNSLFCSPEKSCTKQINNVHRFIRKPALFQHVGKHSSLKNKVQLLREKNTQRSSTPKLEDHVVNGYNGVEITTNPVFFENSEEFTKFFKYGLPLQFNSPPKGLELQLNFNETIQMKQVEIRFAMQSKSPITGLPLIVKYLKANSTTGAYQSLNSTSKYFFHYKGANQIPISGLQITCQDTFDYFVYTLLLIR